MNYLYAAMITLVLALGLHGYDCITGTHEQCLMSRGLLILYWPAFFIIFGIPGAMIANSHAKSKTESAAQDHENSEQ